MTEDQQTDLAIAYWTALDIHLKNPSIEQWGILMSGANIALVLAQRGHGKEKIDTIQEAISGLERAKERASNGMSWALDSRAIAAIRETLTVHDAQCASATVYMLKEALRLVRKQAERLAA